MKKGFAMREWYKIRQRNEALDCRVYAYAAQHSLQIDMKMLIAAVDGQGPQQQKGRRTSNSMQ